MLRGILFNLFFWPVFVGYLTIMYPFVRLFNQKQTQNIIYRKVTKWLVFCLRFFAGVNHQINGIEKLKNQIKESGQVVIGCNHQSTWETFIFSIILDDLTVVAKKELFSLPIAGIYFEKLECIPVNRSSVVSSIKSLIKHGKMAIKNKRSILIFPNGTRSSASEQAEYKSGIYALYKLLDKPVVPCFVNSGEFWSRRSFKKTKGTIILDFKDPILPGLGKDEFMSVFEQRQRSSDK